MTENYYSQEELRKWVVECDRHTIGTVKLANELLNEIRHEGEVSLLDIGANVGAFPKLLEQYHLIDKLVVVEPYIQFTDIILERFPDATVFNCLASDREVESVYFYGNREGNLGCAKVMEHYNTENPNFIKLSSLPTWEFIQNVPGFTPNLIKIDAEGHDEQVLLGIIPYLKLFKNRPIIIFEWCSDRQIDETLGKFFELGYELRGMYSGMSSGDLALIYKEKGC